MMPNKPAIAVWLRQAGRGDTGILATMEFSLHPYLLMGRSDNEMSGSAIIIDGLAITTFDSTSYLSASYLI